jgi:hypothetical protein
MTSSDSISGGDVQLNMVDKMAGFLAVASVVLSGLALFRTPALFAPVAAIIAFAASRMSSRIEKLATFAALAAALAFAVGMTLAVITDNSLL